MTIGGRAYSIVVYTFDKVEGSLIRRYSGLTTSGAIFSGIGFIDLRLLRKTPFLTTGEANPRKA